MSLPKIMLSCLLLTALAACTDREINDGIAALKGNAVAAPPAEVVKLYGGYSDGSAVVSEIIVAASIDVSSSAALSSESEVVSREAAPSSSSSSSIEVVAYLAPISSSSSSSEICVPVFRVKECD